MSSRNARHCVEHVPQGKGISVFSVDRFFARGAASVLKADPRANDVVKRHQVSVLHFPDCRHFLGWSLKPTLPAGMILIAGQTRLLAELSGVFSPGHVGLVDTRQPASSLSRTLAAMERHHLQQHSQPVDDIWLNMEQMAFMWGWISGRRLVGDRKRNSRLKKQVMQKLGTDSDIGLLIRFRLMFLLHNDTCLLRGRIKKGENIQEQLSAWTRITLRHNLTGAEYR